MTSNLTLESNNDNHHHSTIKKIQPPKKKKSKKASTHTAVPQRADSDTMPKGLSNTNGDMEPDSNTGSHISPVMMGGDRSTLIHPDNNAVIPRESDSYITKKRQRDSTDDDVDQKRENDNSHHVLNEDLILQGNVEDTLEYKVYQTTVEMIQITIAALRPPPVRSSSLLRRPVTTIPDVTIIPTENYHHDDNYDDNNNDDMKNDGQHREQNRISLPLSSTFSWEDSILATPKSCHSQCTNIFTMDISSTISSMMYQAPVLRHRHVAVSEFSVMSVVCANILKSKKSFCVYLFYFPSFFVRC
jgi:hypothetical protein